MSKKNVLIHLNSKELNYTGDGAKLPLTSDLEYGEIAINYKDGYETISIKNDNDVIIPFNAVSLSEKELWNQKDRIYNETKTVSVITKDSGITIGYSGNTATGNYSVAEGIGTKTSNGAEHASGIYNVSILDTNVSEITKSTTATLFSVGNGTDDENRHNAFEIKYNGDVYIPSNLINGIRNTSINNSHAEGENTNANNAYSHTEGYKTTTNGRHSHAEGNSTVSEGTSSHAEGSYTRSAGNYSHAEGSNSIASGLSSHAEGYQTRTDGNFSHAEGYATQANGDYSHVEGLNNVTNNEGEHACGKYNLSTSGSTGDTSATLFSVGMGTATNNRKNAIEITQTGVLKANTSWTTGSDRKLKKDINLLGNNILEKVLQLKPVSFILKDDLSERKQIGFIAQEVEEVFPEYVVIHTNNKGEETRYLDYEKICVVLTKALQEQQTVIDKQNERLSIIEEKLNSL